MKLRFKAEVASDLNEARQWYDDRRTGLGDEFIEAVEKALKLVQEHPRQYRVRARDMRVAPLERFPYGVFYYLDGEVIVVLAVLHFARDPALWRERR